MATVKVLVIGGGGGGGSGITNGGGAGGGGAGGYQYDAAFTVTAQPYTVTVGAGGAGGATPNNHRGVSGGNSVFSTMTSTGGGGGGSSGGTGQESASNGGSGGGARGSATVGTGTGGQGNNGGNSPSSDGAGGGGGSSSTGFSGGADDHKGYKGGDGTANSITGSSVTRAGGGGGGSWDSAAVDGGGTGGGGSGGSNAAGANATANTGSGGGGAGATTSAGYAGGNGAAGVVIISYVTADFKTCTGGTITTDGVNTVHTFNSSGTFTVDIASPGAVTFMSPGGDATQDLNFFSGSSGTVVVDTSVSHTGTSSLRLDTGATPTTALLNTYTGICLDSGTQVSFYARFSNVTPASNSNFFILKQSGGTAIHSLQISTTGKVRNNPTGATVVTGSTTLSTNTWYRISISYYITNTTTFTFKVYINGVLESTATAGTLTNVTSDKFSLSASDNFGTNQSVWFDDIYVATGLASSSSQPDTGDIRVTAKRPNANGTANNFVTQIGAGGSGYGSGHSPQVNEQPGSDSNGWSVVAVAATTEEYNVENISTGDVNLTLATIVDTMGWVRAKSLLSETASIVVNGVSSNISLTSTITTFTQIADSSQFPLGTGTDIGIISSSTATTVSLYEAGIIVAFIPGSSPSSSASSSISLSPSASQSPSSSVSASISKSPSSSISLSPSASQSPSSSVSLSISLSPSASQSPSSSISLSLSSSVSSSISKSPSASQSPSSSVSSSVSLSPSASQSPSSSVSLSISLSPSSSQSPSSSVSSSISKSPSASPSPSASISPSPSSSVSLSISPSPSSSQSPSSSVSSSSSLSISPSISLSPSSSVSASPSPSPAAPTAVWVNVTHNTSVWVNDTL